MESKADKVYRFSIQDLSWVEIKSKDEKDEKDVKEVKSDDLRLFLYEKEKILKLWEGPESTPEKQIEGKKKLIEIKKNNPDFKVSKIEKI